LSALNLPSVPVNTLVLKKETALTFVKEHERKRKKKKNGGGGIRGCECLN